MIKKYCDRCGKDAADWMQTEGRYHIFYEITQLEVSAEHKRPKKIHLCPKCEAGLSRWLDKKD